MEFGSQLDQDRDDGRLVAPKRIVLPGGGLVSPPVSAGRAAPVTAGDEIPEEDILFDDSTGHDHDGAGGGTPITISGDVTGTNNAAVVEAARGIEFPTPAAGDDGEALVYNHGTGAYVLTALSASSLKHCKAYNNTTQSIPNATATALTFNAEEADTDAFHDNGTNPSRLTIPTGQGGVYLVTAFAYFGINGTGNRFLWLRVNGSAVRGGGASEEGHLTRDTRLGLAAILVLAAGDYIEAFVQQDTGGAFNAGDAAAAEKQNFLAAVKIA